MAALVHSFSEERQEKRDFDADISAFLVLCFCGSLCNASLSKELVHGIYMENFFDLFLAIIGGTRINDF